MQTGSLFTGCGALDLTLNHTPTWMCEIDPNPRHILTTHYPHTTIHTDITTLPSLTPLDPVSLIHGGSPCQSNSVAGTRKGITNDAPSGLWSHQIRLTQHLTPQWAIWENVKGALSAPATTRANNPDSGETPPNPKASPGRPHRMRALGRVLADYHQAGYNTAWTTIPAALIGAPHRRDRVFVLAHHRRFANWA